MHSDANKPSEPSPPDSHGYHAGEIFPKHERIAHLAVQESGNHDNSYKVGIDIFHIPQVHVSVR